MKNYWQKIPLTAALSMTFLSSIIYCPALWALPVALNSSSIKFIPPPPPPDRGAAGDRGGAASRGCGSGNESLMALVPIYQQTINQEPKETIAVTKVWGLTTAVHSTFWFFVPYHKSAIAAMEFVVKDESGKPSQTIHRAAVNPPSNPGIVSVRLPETTAPLQVGKMYHWFLKVKVNCNNQQPAELQYVEGWVQRINPNSSLAQNLKQATPQQQVALYAENGIWHDALTVVATLRWEKPKDASVIAEWTSLLKSVGLENLAQQPLVNCCQELGY
ncbi:hypothetical protein BV378_19645 [Nostoc sp. RF31YmG]|nr:hypothetical protein BV378_19645 [Nostoc sp. RF31YmG]